jgi:dolichyl-phosphate beta-glucosyltransferase
MGKGESVRRGVLFAADKAEYLGYWDADLSTPLDLIPDLVAVLKQRSACLVMGTRIKITGHEIIRKPYRHYQGRVFATLASAVIGHGFYDTQCGAKVFRQEIVAPCFAQPFLSRWCFDIELILRVMDCCGVDDVNTLESRILEIPLRRWIDAGDSRLKATDVLRMAGDLARIYYRYRRPG